MMGISQKTGETGTDEDVENNAPEIKTEWEQSGVQQAAVSRRARPPDPFLKERSLASTWRTHVWDHGDVRRPPLRMRDHGCLLHGHLTRAFLPRRQSRQPFSSAEVLFPPSPYSCLSLGPQCPHRSSRMVMFLTPSPREEEIKLRPAEVAQSWALLQVPDRPGAGVVPRDHHRAGATAATSAAVLCAWESDWKRLS